MGGDGKPPPDAEVLGEIPETTIEQVQQVLAQVAAAQKSFELSVEGLGMYPNPKQPRTIWLGVQGVKPLIALHAELEKASVEWGSKKKAGPSILTSPLARVRDRTSREMAHQIGETLATFKVDSLGIFGVSEIHLIESQLTPKGPIYTTRFTAPLGEV